MKPGWKTTEFWLAAIASLVALVIGSGAVVEGSTVGKAIALVAAALASMGYSQARASVKTTEAMTKLPEESQNRGGS